MKQHPTYDMPHSERRVRQKLAAGSPPEDDDDHDDVDVPTAAANHLSASVLAIIFGFLPFKDVMRSRCVCSDWKEAAKGTIVTSCYDVTTVHDFTAMEMIAIPNLEHLWLGRLEEEDISRNVRYIDGDNPNESLAAGTAHYSTHDINVISNFQNLRSLSIMASPLNGEYPVFFNFPLLQKLTINDDPETCHNYIKWDLKVLQRLPMLKELACCTNEAMSGNINSLRVLKDTLETIDIANCRKVVGDFMDLADFPRLKKLDLRGTAVTGDIRDVGANDFKILAELYLPRTVYGGSRYAFGSIAEVTEFMSRIRPLAHRFAVSTSWRLSEESPDWYDDPNQVQVECQRKDHQIPPPFVCELITLEGTRMGWRWRCNFPSHDRIFYTEDGDIHNYLDDVNVFETCEINWLEPEPDRGSSDYEEYCYQLRSLPEEISFFSGYHNPPTADEYYQLLNELLEAEEIEREQERLRNEQIAVLVRNHLRGRDFARDFEQGY